MIWRIILWFSVIWLVPLMYFFLRNETKFKKNIAVGVTLPYEARTHPEVLVLSARFKKELDWICQAWRKCWVWRGWFMALVNLGLAFGFRWPLMGTVLLVVLSGALMTAMVGLEFQLRKLQEKLTASSGRDFCVDEDDKWLWGMFYYDPDDSHLMVNARVGLNTTVNLARPAGKVIMGLTAALLLLMPLAGVWLTREERALVTLTLTDTVLVAAHSGTRYEIPLEGMDSVELLEELPPIRRVAGTAMETVDKGSWRSGEYGLLTVCLDPRTGPWLLVRAGETTWLVGSGDGSAGAVFEALTARLAGQRAPAAQPG